MVGGGWGVMGGGRGGIVPGGGRILLRTENRVRSAADRDFDFTTAEGGERVPAESCGLLMT